MFNLRAVRNRMVLGAGAFNHCSTITPISEGMLIAFYAGMGECRDDQSVFILFIKNKSIEFQVRIGDLTGNPVLWSINDKKAILFYSKFEDTKPLKRIVDRWKYCSSWTRTVEIDDSGIKLGEPQRQLIRPHLLGRCAPIVLDDPFDTMLLPLYDEVNAEGVIYAIEGKNRDVFREVSSLGTGMIQPTLWPVFSPSGLKIMALSRNFGNKQLFSNVCVSFDLGESWTTPTPTDITNNNSSLHACLLKNDIYLLWNSTRGRARINMTLGQVDVIDQQLVCTPITQISEYGHYPTMISHNGRLHFTFTNRGGEIEYHEWNKRQITNARKATEAEYRGDPAGST